MSEQLSNSLVNWAAGVGVHLDQAMIRLLFSYFRELKEWNQKINLISHKDDRTILINHFIDSLSLIPHLPSTGCLLDLGSGAGFPGLPLKIVRPEFKVTLLESKRKKVSFLQHIIRILKLSDIDILHGRAEHLLSEEQIPPRFGIITARAFSKFDRLLELSRPLLEEGGYLVAMKGPEGERELQASKDILDALSLETVKTVKLTLPHTHKKRFLFFIIKR